MSTVFQPEPYLSVCTISTPIGTCSAKLQVIPSFVIGDAINDDEIVVELTIPAPPASVSMLNERPTAAVFQRKKRRKGSPSAFWFKKRMRNPKILSVR